MGTSQHVFGGIPYKVTGSAPKLPKEWTNAYTAPTQWELCCKFESQQPIPVDFISFPLYDNASANSIPPNTAELRAGIPRNVAYRTVECGIYKFEMGAGPDARVLYADLTPGRWALGPQTQCTVYASRYSGVATGLTDIIVRSAIAPSDGTGDYVPFSATVTPLAAGASVALSTIVPPGAQYVDIGVEAATILTGNFKVRTNFGNPLYRDYLNGVFYPSLGTPLPVTSGIMDFENFGANALNAPNYGFVKFWCQP